MVLTKSSVFEGQTLNDYRKGDLIVMLKQFIVRPY